MPIEQRKMPYLLACSALALVLAASGCSDHKNAEMQKTASTHNKAPMQIKFNAPPVARAGTNLIVKVGDVVSLNGTQSSDPDQDLMTFDWTQVAGPKVDLINADTSSPSFVAPASKTPLEFSLVVNDGQVDSAPSKVTITVSNRPPIANAGKTIIAQRGSTVSLDGGASEDPDNDNISYHWQQVYGPVVSVTGANTPNPVFTMPNASGYIIFALTVDDGTDKSVADTVAIKVTNTPPVAHVVQNINNVEAGTKVTLDGTGSSDADGDKLSYHWRQVLGTPVMLQDSNTAKPSFKAPNRPDELVFQLTVSDGEFNSFPDSTVISVKNAPKPTENVSDKTIISRVKEKQKGLTAKEKNLPVLPVISAPKPVDNFIKDMAKDFKPDTTKDEEGSKPTMMTPKSSS